MDKNHNLSTQSKKPLRVLQLLLTLDETQNPYYQHCLPVANERDITICTYFKSAFTLPSEFTLFEGDGSFTGFFRTIRAALAEKEYDLIHAHSPHIGFLFLIASLFRPRKHMPSMVYTVHNSYLNYKMRNKLLYIPIFAFFQRIVCCSKASFISFPRFYKWLAGNRLYAIENGIDLDDVDRIITDSGSNSPDDKFTVITVSRLVEIKNLLTLSTAFKQTANSSSRLVFVGDGPLKSALLSERETSGLANQVEVTGFIPRPQVYERLAGADLFISCSRGEGLPVAALEAMACRCPVILSDIPPHREIVTDVDFIPLIQPDDMVGFAEEIKRFREMTLEERAYIGEKCRKLTEDQFSLVSMHKKYEQLYTQLLAEHNGKK